jgi:hypothetical protein
MSPGESIAIVLEVILALNPSINARSGNIADKGRGKAARLERAIYREFQISIPSKAGLAQLGERQTEVG